MSAGGHGVMPTAVTAMATSSGSVALERFTPAHVTRRSRAQRPFVLTGPFAPGSQWLRGARLRHGSVSPRAEFLARIGSLVIGCRPTGAPDRGRSNHGEGLSIMDFAFVRARAVSRAAVPIARAIVLGSLAVLAVLALGAPAVRAQAAPAGTPVRWDQARVTKIAQELSAAIHDAREAVRKSPLDHANVGQRTTFYELQEDIRLADNTAQHLSKELEAGKDAEQTRASFDRIGSLRLSAEENGRRALIEASVMDALVKAGELHNRLKPYYYGKR